jgi:hypothetical protein
MSLIPLLADRNEAINQWLDQNPLVLGLIFVALGLLIGGWGAYELKTGVASTKRGKSLSGTQGQALSIIRIVAGVGCLLFGLYKLLA